ncbi:protein ETHYLENE-INSENSITIVE 2 isoform X1 [Dendrobium catenatum]|uniref:Ethylene-insensitive protein 2 n=1 Tax=Dendrobium catenatum TaxID=906689 RepID=A0A2I0WC90_9ASPA|nr:protein ETHYLENE-INSENSITIVE 2 isoform X1 [Dendrobium catenatum]PKU73272.1 Ethylene-insensitive protein 2 [Dendrobium catenatum]
MAIGGFGGATTHIFPSLGPAILVSMTYIDLGKWLVAVEGGARFGFEIVLTVLIFNCIAILCQFLSTGIVMVTRKNLAEICNEEYTPLPCLLLGVQAELSMIISDLTMVLGIAQGVNLLFGMDLLSCILFAILGAILLPFLINLSDNNGKAAEFFVYIAGFALLFYVFGVLISQPEVPVIDEFLPKLTGENAYAVMALLGANIMSHNFYIHSAIIQQQGRQSNVALGALFYDHFFAILFIFTGIFLVNYVLITSAAAVFGNTDVVALNFQDISLVMEQIFKNPIAPVAFLLVLLVSCQITALNRNIGSQVILQHFFSTKISGLVLPIFSKAFTAILALFCTKIGGAEGIYQSLIVSQIILGMLVPSATIPLFRVASSRVIMGTFKISWYTEILALLAFFGMITVNFIFIVEILFGNSSWAINLWESNVTGTIILFTLLILGFTSICFTIYLAVTPLKSASSIPDAQISTRVSQNDLPEFFERIEESNLEEKEYNEEMESMAEATFEKYVESQSDKSTIEYNPDVSQATIDSDHDSQQSTYGSNINVDVTSPTYHSEGSAYMTEERLSDVRYKDSIEPLHGEESFHQQTTFAEPVAMNLRSEIGLHTVKDNEAEDALELEELTKASFPPLISESPKPVNIAKGTGKDGGNGSGSLSKLSGLGRAGRRQFATILDEFWGNLFDFHGKLTQDASSKRLNVLLGLDFKAVNSFGKADTTAAETSKFLSTDAEKGQTFLPSSGEYSSPNQMNVQGADLPFCVRRGNLSWSSMQRADAVVQSSRSNVFDLAERTYSSLHLPHCSDDRDYQPATIHGYQIASFLEGINTGRPPYSISTQNLPPTTKFSPSYVSPLRDQIMHSHGQNRFASTGTSSLQNPALSRISTLQAERPYFESHLMGPSEHAISPAYTKKYHSSPDISAIIATAKSSYLNEGKQSTPIGPQTSFGRMASEKSQYLNPLARAGVPLAFNELSPKMHKEIFPLQPSLNPETKSLFSRQPFEELFGMMGGDRSGGNVGAAGTSSSPAEEAFPYADSEAKLLYSLRFCIMKLLKLDGSDWLFRQGGGADEELIDQVAVAEKCLHIDSSEMIQPYADEFQYLPSDWKLNSVKRSEESDIPFRLTPPNCGDGCVWRAALIVCFGVWCIQRILELLVVESRPELWGKYTYVLNRLQGIIEPAFSKRRFSLRSCTCLDISIKSLTNFSSSSTNGVPFAREKDSQKSLTSASMVLDLIKEVESAVSNRKGRTGTAAGDVAFPKGKENLASVLKRYKRRLSSKQQGPQEGTSLRKIPFSSPSGL